MTTRGGGRKDGGRARDKPDRGRPRREPPASGRRDGRKQANQGRSGTSANRNQGRAPAQGKGRDAKRQPRQPPVRKTRPAARQPSVSARRPGTPKKRRVPPFRFADPRKRIKVLLVGLCVVLSLLAGRLVQLQGLDASTYAVAANQIGRTDTTLPAPRGDIVDRNGAPLARAVEAYNVFVDQTQVSNPAAYALQLDTVLDEDVPELQERLSGDRPFAYIAKDVSGSTWRDIEELDLRGIDAEDADGRTYPAGPVGGSVVGFTGSDGEPLAGLELSQDDVLAGQDGHVVRRRSPTGERIPTEAMVHEEPVAGDGLRLTLDRDIQWYAEEALSEAVENADADGGAAVVLEMAPESHEIVALASDPSVDPNEPSDTPAGDRGSRAVEEAYEPGSIFKPLTMAAILEEGAAEVDSVYSVPGQIRRSGHTIHDHYSHPEQEMTLAGILAKSSNVGTLLAAEGIDAETFRGYLSDFGLGSVTGIGLPAETAGRLPELEEWSSLTHDNISFGQGVSVNAVQLASAYATIATGGVRFDPMLISATIDPDGNEVPVDPAEPERVISEETAAQVTSMMESVMGEDGTGADVALDGYRVAGKTGTAQRVDPECGCYSQYNASFMGFAPAEDPRYVVVVSLMNPRNGNSGGALAGPAFHDIMRFALENGGVPPSVDEAPELPLFADEIVRDEEESAASSAGSGDGAGGGTDDGSEDGGSAVPPADGAAEDE
ncbi:hypothetical protein EF847_09065 [Actinobacteria bacterium YIM 96077]|uniref:Penicillin-binding protein 2 n=1 Tax=Phytoactinopolyspora halophila TaxID=1981511 RepID=A0A329R0B6_9ACTN|nr:penicillin-binding protein 2 [Phytoactinopolyspora halophila]AYY12839.1 hypothetical protein EF847_09065 [Actinobacteria bacterium YIM 96077]RAW16368.1 hypothetical protein DPM12_06955 [Phytoactinopolyspora halophila]